MAANLLAAGYEVHAWARRDFSDLPELSGVSRAESPRQLASDTTVIIIMLPDLPQLQEILSGDDGLAAGFGSESTLVVCSSVSAVGLRELVAGLTMVHQGLSVIDAPVSGGVEGARAGTLSIMVGGERETFERVTPVLESMGRPRLLGPLGSGEVAKACNQLIVAATMAAVSEAAVIAASSGLDVKALFNILQGGYADSRVLQTKAAKLTARDYSVDGALKYMVKDLTAASDEARRGGAFSPQLDLLLDEYRSAVDRGFGDFDLAAIHAWLESSGAAGSKEGTIGLLN